MEKKNIPEGTEKMKPINMLFSGTPDKIETTSDGSRLSVCFYKNVPLMPVDNLVERMEMIKSMKIRQDDIFLVTYPKSGTNWTRNLVVMLLERDLLKGHAKPLEIENSNFYDMIEADPSPRVFVTHADVEFLPQELLEENKGRVITVLRNPKDTLVSFFHQLKAAGIYEGTFAGIFELFMQRKMIFGDWYQYNKNLVDFAGKKNGLILRFEDLKQDGIKEVRRIAEFLNISATDDKIASFLEAVSISNVRKHISTVDNAFMKKAFEVIYRKGDVGDWKNHFTVAMNEQFDADYNEQSKITGLSHKFEI